MSETGEPGPRGGTAGTRGAAGPGGSRRRRPALVAGRPVRNALVLASVIVLYYAVPVGRPEGGARIAVAALGLLGGVALLGWLIVRQARLLVHGDPGDQAVRIETLLFLLYVVVPMFALGYYALERADGEQFASLATRTDALYFTLSTLATVGFGDVHATGQLARALVTIQIAFDLVFVAALVSLLTGQIRSRAARRRPSPEDTGDG